MRRVLISTVIATSIMLGPLAVADSVSAAPVAPAVKTGWSGPCHDAVRAYWPAQWQNWAHYVVNRESRGLPYAANPRSSARGCFQMLLRYSAPFYRAVGCNNYQWNNATCNVRAALVMRTRHGVRPWAMPTRRR